MYKYWDKIHIRKVGVQALETRNGHLIHTWKYSNDG